MKEITENYFGSPLECIDVLETKYGKIYVCRIDGYFVFYDEKGNDPMELSSIDIEEFEVSL